jgi:hypothetical protein
MLYDANWSAPANVDAPLDVNGDGFLDLVCAFLHGLAGEGDLDRAAGRNAL